MRSRNSNNKRFSRNTSWDPVADWYAGWVGDEGSKHHTNLAIPAVLDLLDIRQDDNVLDIGAGHGVLCPYITKQGARYVGVEISPRLLRIAKQQLGIGGEFIQGDATELYKLPELSPESFDAVVFLLSIQDMDPLEDVIYSASWALKTYGRLIILMTHPCFRVPRQSGWGWDEGRKLQYRRIDRYFTPLDVPMKAYEGKTRGVTYSFHRPLQSYINALSINGLAVDRMDEIPTYKVIRSDKNARAINAANKEIPLFLGLRAIKFWHNNS